MRVKIKDTWYDGQEIPIMILFENNEEKKAIGNMLANNMKMATFPDGMPKKELQEFMEVDESYVAGYVPKLKGEDK